MSSDITPGSDVQSADSENNILSLILEHKQTPTDPPTLLHQLPPAEGAQEAARDVDPPRGGAAGRSAVGVRAGEPVLHPAEEKGARPRRGAVR